jgi:hypothetical protein
MPMMSTCTHSSILVCQVQNVYSNTSGYINIHTHNRATTCTSLLYILLLHVPTLLSLISIIIILICIRIIIISIRRIRIRIIIIIRTSPKLNRTLGCKMNHGQEERPTIQRQQSRRNPKRSMTLRCKTAIPNFGRLKGNNHIGSRSNSNPSLRRSRHE